MILGIDEVGRGPWAGPLVVGAVVLPNGANIEGLTDSKKLSAKKREKLATIIHEVSLGYGLGWVYPEELDAIGLSESLRRATIRAVQSVPASYHQIIIDGTINFLSGTEKGKYVQTLPKADALIPAVSAASIIAKVARDAYMVQQDAIYPQYGFASHVGYGTAKHRQALEKYGITTLHRRSFAPIARLIDGANIAQPVRSSPSASLSSASSPSPSSPVPISPNNEPLASSSKQSQSASLNNTKKIGDAAEQYVAEWLQTNGFAVVDRNWRTRRCEIDCIADKNNTRYFIEVKYRSSSQQGGGVAAITTKKLQQMKFAAELYTASHAYKGSYQLAVVSVNARRNIALIEIT